MARTAHPGMAGPEGQEKLILGNAFAYPSVPGVRDRGILTDLGRAELALNVVQRNRDRMHPQPFPQTGEP